MEREDVSDPCGLTQYASASKTWKRSLTPRKMGSALCSPLAKSLRSFSSRWIASAVRRRTQESTVARCSPFLLLSVIVKASSGPRYLVGCRNSVPKHKLKPGTRISLDMTTLTIMRVLPREVDPQVYNMSMEDPAGASFAGIGGLSEQIREIRETIELPLMNPELFQRVGIAPPKGVLLYGPPGTGKTLLARAVAATLDTNFLKVVASAIVDKFIGSSAKLIREMFAYAKDHEPTIIFMDELDAIGGRRFSEGTSADREVQRTLMEVRYVLTKAALQR